MKRSKKNYLFSHEDVHSRRLAHLGLVSRVGGRHFSNSQAPRSCQDETFPQTTAYHQDLRVWCIIFIITIHTTRYETREGFETILVENEDPANTMTKFFGRHHGRRRTDHHTDKESGLSDKTNFPLLSSKWMRGRADASTTDHSANFSARRLFSVSDRSLTQSSSSAPSPSELIKPDPKAVSPTQDVASTWMQMGSDESSKGAFPSVPSSARANTRDRATNNTNQKQSRQSSSKTTTTSTASSRGSSIQRSSRYASHNNSRSTMRKPRQQAHPVSNGAKASEWRSALDPKSGRTYFYNVRTRETQWRKPMELASPEERKEMEEKERKQKDFFAAMEANILSQMAAGVVPGTPKVSPNTTTTDVEMKEPPTRPKKPMLEKPRMVRTISGMDDQILKELVKRVPSLRNTSSSMKMSRDNSLSMEELGKMHDEGHLSNISEESMNMSAMEISLADLNYDMDVDGDSPSAREEHHALMQLAKTAEQMAMSSGSSANISPVEPPKPNGGKAKLPSGALKRPSLLDSRRNTCGTMYVGSTMSAPDKDATIKVRFRVLFFYRYGNSHRNPYSLSFLGLDSIYSACVESIVLTL